MNSHLTKYSIRKLVSLNFYYYVEGSLLFNLYSKRWTKTPVEVKPTKMHSAG